MIVENKITSKRYVLDILSFSMRAAAERFAHSIIGHVNEDEWCGWLPEAILCTGCQLIKLHGEWAIEPLFADAPSGHFPGADFDVFNPRAMCGNFWLDATEIIECS